MLLDEQRFDVISGAVRPVRGDPHPLETQICYHIFDIADPTGELTQTQRLAKLRKLFNRPGIAEKCPHIKMVPTKLVNTIEEINTYHDLVASKGYEGVVIRAKDLKYQSHKKALEMRKHKYFVDEEFIITGVECDEGVEREHFTWLCTRVDDEDVVVTAKPTGEIEQRWIWYDNIDDYVGKLLTIRYQGPLTVGGNLRFPRGVHIRDEDEVDDEGVEEDEGDE
jgi:ATP-dependent DNA ligase